MEEKNELRLVGMVFKVEERKNINFEFKMERKSKVLEGICKKMKKKCDFLHLLQKKKST